MCSGFWLALLDELRCADFAVVGDRVVDVEELVDWIVEFIVSERVVFVYAHDGTVVRLDACAVETLQSTWDSTRKLEMKLAL